MHITRKIAPNLRDPGDQWKAGVGMAACLTGVLAGSGVVQLVAAICLAIVALVIGIGAWFTWVAPCPDGEDEEDPGLLWVPPV